MNDSEFDIRLRLDVQDIYAEYAEVLDTQELERWPEFFVEDAFYDVIPRENFERNLPLAIMRCESQDMMRDRVRAIRETLMFEPRYTRHLISNIRVQTVRGEQIQVNANYLILETLADEVTRVHNTGRYVDTLVRKDNVLRFKEKRCIYDSSLVPNSLIYPI